MILINGESLDLGPCFVRSFMFHCRFSLLVVLSQCTVHSLADFMFTVTQEICQVGVVFFFHQEIAVSRLDHLLVLILPLVDQILGWM
jgi:hypothetical protein